MKGTKSIDAQSITGDYGRLVRGEIDAKEVLSWLISYFPGYRENDARTTSKGQVYRVALELEELGLPRSHLVLLIPMPDAVDLARMQVLPEVLELTPIESQIVSRESKTLAGEPAEFIQTKDGTCRLMFRTTKETRIALWQDGCENPAPLLEFADQMNVKRLKRRFEQ